MCYTDQAVKGETSLRYAAVAQLDRVTGYEPVGRGFESLQPYHVVADFVSFATTFSFSKQTSSLIHSVAPPFKIETALLGFDFVSRPVGGLFLSNVASFLSTQDTSEQALYRLLRLIL